uniref:RBR-type E3 ubiquitin transferase n=1 Tax=Caenorhabditis tropicalis TaxID=1561998 RepID=A0A1I7U101_9PELO
MMDLDEEYYMYKTDKSDDIQYEFLSSEDLKTEMTTIIENVKAMLQYPSGICRILLQQHKWSNQLLLDKFYENPDPNDFLAKCGLLPEGSVIVSEEQECPICCISGKLFGLACNHMACVDCWSAYIDGKMKAKRSEIECMQLDCKLLMVDEKVTEFIKDASIYEDVIINSYVKTHKTLRWCPETCRTAVRVKTPVHSLISCPCGVNYCFTCGNEGHEPINCRLLRKWLRRCQDDNSSYKWLNANTKDCPTCQTPIEKTGGCNHMTCQKCKKHFCWLCLTPWNLRHDCSR